MTINLEQKSTEQFRNLDQVQKIIKQASVTIDADLLKLIDEAEAGDYEVMDELWRAFTFGLSGAKPNQYLAKRYLFAIHERNKIWNEPYCTAQSIADLAIMNSQFETDQNKVVDVVTEAIRYMVNKVEPKHWDTERLYELQAILDSLLNPAIES